MSSLTRDEGSVLRYRRYRRLQLNAMVLRREHGRHSGWTLEIESGRTGAIFVDLDLIPPCTAITSTSVVPLKGNKMSRGSRDG